MKKLFSLLTLLFIASSIFALSFLGENVEDPFESQEELDNFSFDESGFSADDVKIYLITAETGDEVFTFFGHTALAVVKDGSISFAADYGSFSFSEGFYLKFVEGLLLYNMVISDLERRVQVFENEGRTYYLTEITGLENREKKGIIDFLLYNSQEGNNVYLYHYYEDNCATRVRDILNWATGGDFAESYSHTYRGATYRNTAALYLDKSFLFSFLLNYLQGPEIDREISLYDEMYLPLTLKEAAEDYFSSSSVKMNTDTERSEYRSFTLMEMTAVLSSILFLSLSALYASRIKLLTRISDFVFALIFILFSLLSSALIILEIFSNHSVTYFNSNFIYASPLLLLAAAEAIKGKSIRRRFYLSLIHLSFIAVAVMLKGLFPLFFIQENLFLFVFLSPLYIINIIRYALSCHQDGKEKEEVFQDS